MNVLVIGASGKVGREIVKALASAAGKTPVAQVRHQQQADDYRQQGIETRLIDLEADVATFVDAMQGIDAIIFSAGSGASTGDDKTLLVDLDGAIKTMQAAEEAGIKRYVMVSAIGADRRERWNDALLPYYAAKHYADEWLAASGLYYTILRPGALTDEAGTQQIDVGYPTTPGGNIPRADVAAVALAALDEPATLGKAFDFVGGRQPIDEALKAL